MSRLYVYEGKRRNTYYTIAPGNKRVNLGHDLMEAKRKLLAMDGAPGETVVPGTIADHLADLMRSRRDLAAAGKLSQATIATNEDEVEQLIKAFGAMQPEAVRPTHVWAYLHKYRGLESPVRANREVALFSKLFNRLMGAGVVDHNPCAGVERNEEVARERLVNDAELGAFVHFCWRSGDAGKRVAMAAMIAYLTGKALSQVLKLNRTQFRPDGIEFEKRKRGAAVFVEWSPRLRRYVKLALDMESAVTPMHVIHTGAGTAYTASGFKSLWQRHMKAWEDAGNERFTFHDLRAKAVTDVIEQGRQASELTGHRTEAIVAKVYDRRRTRRAAPVR